MNETILSFFIIFRFYHSYDDTKFDKKKEVIYDNIKL